MKGIKNSLENSSDHEIEPFNQILELYKEVEQDPSKRVRLMGKSFIELMSLADNSEYNEVIKNGLILIQALFEDKAPDMYHSKGCSFDQLDIKDKCVVLDILKKEFQGIFFQ